MRCFWLVPIKKNPFWFLVEHFIKVQPVRILRGFYLKPYNIKGYT